MIDAYEHQQTDEPNNVRELRLTTGDVVRRAGIERSTFSAYVARGQAPKPDGRFDKRTPYWYESTIDKWIESRASAK